MHSSDVISLCYECVPFSLSCWRMPNHKYMTKVMKQRKRIRTSELCNVLITVLWLSKIVCIVDCIINFSQSIKENEPHVTPMSF